MFAFSAAYMTYVYSYQGVYCRKCEQMFKKSSVKLAICHCGVVQWNWEEMRRRKFSPATEKRRRRKVAATRLSFTKKIPRNYTSQVEASKA